MRTYPYYAEIDEKQYKINTDYKIALACMRIVDDEDISDIERAYAIVGLLFGEDTMILNMEKAIDIARKYLMCGKTFEEQEQSPADMDYEQDGNLIQASFMSDYKIDLEKEELHWWKFCDLISGLTDQSILNKVRDIRNWDISNVTDTKERSKIIRAKEKVAIKKKRSKREQEELDEFEALLK